MIRSGEQQEEVGFAAGELRDREYAVDKEDVNVDGVSLQTCDYV